MTVKTEVFVLLLATQMLEIKNEDECQTKTLRIYFTVCIHYYHYYSYCYYNRINNIYLIILFSRLKHIFCPHRLFRKTITANANGNCHSFLSTVTIVLRLNCFDLACKNIIPLSFFLMRFFKHNPGPRDN